MRLLENLFGKENLKVINLGDNEHLITYDAFTDAIFELEKHKDYSVIHEDGDE